MKHIFGISSLKRTYVILGFGNRHIRKQKTLPNTPEFGLSPLDFAPTRALLVPNANILLVRRRERCCLSLKAQRLLITRQRDRGERSKKRAGKFQQIVVRGQRARIERQHSAHASLLQNVDYLQFLACNFFTIALNLACLEIKKFII